MADTLTTARHENRKEKHRQLNSQLSRVKQKSFHQSQYRLTGIKKHWQTLGLVLSLEKQQLTQDVEISSGLKHATADRLLSMAPEVQVPSTTV